ncbi:hypothetical protein [Streptomyces uncialis]|uniref:hypothetical protein n=1 Tax=Streptomyces uncialis TaxID=1048205 RepID=UPI002256EC71|nr:hypothetical protein [Streptomyces uncialis]MCX4664233.1 hypothetical protein [Streptomyces uncialis]
MTDGGLFPQVPPVSGEHCCLCGRWTVAPVAIGYGSMSGSVSVTHHVCAEHVHARGPCTADHTTRGPGR